ncbi:MAG: class I tRNA ligase family protein [Sphingobacteriales bacterium]|nr:class I tRNA ligase family protein [Sphingobacteriales bacterium]
MRKGTCRKCGHGAAYGDQCEKCGSSARPLRPHQPRIYLSGRTPFRQTDIGPCRFGQLQRWVKPRD